jgi:predicted phage tail protein
MLTTVVLGGPLGRRFGRVWRLDLGVPSPAEAVRALSAVCKGFARYLVENSAPGFHVFDGKQDVGAEELATPAAGSRVITVMPALAGAKAGWFQVVLGAVLIAGGAVMTLTGFGAAFAPTAFGLGASLVVGGVSQLLFAPPTPLAPVERPENQPSYTFNGPVNTLGQGHPVPICYGELEVGNCVISAGIVTEWNAGGGFGGTGGSGQQGPGGAPSGGGGCPAPWVPVLMADGREVPAGELRVGDWVRTQHEATLAWGAFPSPA